MASFTVMQRGMFAIAQDVQIVESVVVALTIPMVDMLIAAQWSANGLLDNLAVFIDGALFAFWGTYAVSHIPLLIFAVHCVSFFAVLTLASSPCHLTPVLDPASRRDSRCTRQCGLFQAFLFFVSPVKGLGFPVCLVNHLRR